MLGRLYFDQEDELMGEVLQQNQAIVKHYQCRDVSSKDLSTTRIVQQSLEPKFDRAKHFVSSFDGKSNFGNIHYDHIQELFIANNTKFLKLKSIHLSISCYHHVLSLQFGITSQLVQRIIGRVMVAICLNTIQAIEDEHFLP